MLALTSKDYSKAVSKYLLSFDLENWKILSDNYYKLTPFEMERIIEEITSKMDFHMVLDLLSLAHILGQSISLSNSLIKSFTKIDINPIDTQVHDKIKGLLNSPFAEERRIGLLMAGYFDMDEFFPIIEKMSNYDVLFEDAYFALGLFTNKKIIELLSTKFIYLGKNTVQRYAIAKILASKGNPLAALWLFKNKGLDTTTQTTKSIYLSRDLAWSGIQPSLYLDSDDDFLQPMTLKMVNGLAFILPYDIDLIKEINLFQLVNKLIKMQQNKPTIELIKATLSMKLAIEEIYLNIDPYSISKETREEIINSWRLIDKYPDTKMEDYAREYILENLNLESPDLLKAIKLIRCFNLKEYEQLLIEFTKQISTSNETLFEIVSTLGYIGTETSADFIINTIKDQIDFDKRSLLIEQITQFHSDIDYFDDIDNEQLKLHGQTLEDDIIIWNEGENEDIFYWNALFSLGKIKSEKAIPILLESLTDYDPKIRLEAISSLRAINKFEPEIEEKLITLMSNEQFMSVQRQAILTLGSLSSEQVIPIYIKSIYDSLEDGTLELAGEMIESYDARWDEDEQTGQNTDGSSVEEIGATQNIPRKMNSSQEKLVDEDINRWIKRFADSNQSTLELREDFNDQELDLTLESEVIEESTISEYITEEENFETDIETEEEKDDEWFSELGERFKKLTIVESAIEALKTTKAKIPANDIKELLEHPIDEELYKDVLLILAKTGDTFAIHELIGLFDVTDYLRAREIVRIISQVDMEAFSSFSKRIVDSPDWIIKNLLKKTTNGTSNRDRK